MPLPFIKMNGAGNDFVIIDARAAPLRLTPGQVRRLAARDNADTRGCDQVIVMEAIPALVAGSGAKLEPDPAMRRGLPDVFMRIYNADGGEVDACGNATRCVGWLIMQEKNAGQAVIQTHADTLPCEIRSFGDELPQWRDATALVTAHMGAPKFGWRDIPLSQPLDTLHVPLEIEGLSDPACVSMGNPHAVFFVSDPEMVHHIEAVGAPLQRHPLFPEGVNVSIAYIPFASERLGEVPPDPLASRRALRGDSQAVKRLGYISDNPLSGNNVMRVWERGVGLTASCGTAACAVTVAAIRRGLLSAGTCHTITLQNPPSAQTLMATWEQDGQVSLHGPVQMEFEGNIPAFIAGSGSGL